MNKLFYGLMLVVSSTLVPVLSMEPTANINGLAVYRLGEGKPVFLMPYPHASGGSMADNLLADILLGLGRSVITFDPPGAYHSTRAPAVTMGEMLNCTSETLAYFDIAGPIDFAGHSMSSFCALAFAIEHQDRVRELVLVGSMSGWPAVRRWGLPQNWKWWRDREYWKCLVWGTRIALGLGNLAIHKRLDHLVDQASCVDRQYVSPLSVNRGDRRRPLPARSNWFDQVRRAKLDYFPQLNQLGLPVLICVGQYDPQTPVIMNRQLHERIPNSELVIFENSGHSPFIEEPAYFNQVLETFLIKMESGQIIRSASD
ncbi:alpha/beta fold hydrolase [Candidatus Neomarinimicrobiota bacterium]